MSVINITVPPALVFAKVPTIELELAAFDPFEGTEKDCVIKVTLPVVFKEILVKVLLFIVVNWCVAKSDRHRLYWRYDHFSGH